MQAMIRTLRSGCSRFMLFRFAARGEFPGSFLQVQERSTTVRLRLDGCSGKQGNYFKAWIVVLGSCACKTAESRLSADENV